MNPHIKAYGRQTIEEDDIKAVVDALKGDFLTTGPTVQEFEAKFSAYIGCKHSISVSNGTAALDIAVAALNLKRGSEIITTPFTFAADTNCILYNNLKPVFCDINGETLNIDADKIEAKITPKTKAIIYVDFGGRPCEIDKIKDIAQRHNLFLIEDASHAVGGEYDGKRIGSIADMTIFSFHPVKTMTTGEGGMITTNNDKFAVKLKVLRSHGIVKLDALKRRRYGKDAFYEHDFIALGKNYRLTDIQCALGISQLRKLDSFIEKRFRLVKSYSLELAGVEGISTPLAKLKEGNRYSFHLYYILLDRGLDKNNFLVALKSKGIGAHSFYIPTYNFTYHKKKLKVSPSDFPVTEDIFSRIVILPLFPAMEEEDVKYIAESVKSSLKELNKVTEQ